MRRVMITVLLLATAQPARTEEDDCEATGRLVVILGQIETCADYRLTRAGNRLKLGLIRKASEIGGIVCLLKGAAAMRREFGTQRSRREPDTYHPDMCEPVARYLGMLPTEAPLFERRGQ